MQKTYVIQNEFSEKVGLATLGKLKETFATKDIDSVTIDFSNTSWADPLPLLMLGCLLAENTSKCKITIDLGTTENDSHKVLLKYLSTQKFLLSYSKFATARLVLSDKKSSDNDKLISDWREVIGKTENLPHSMHMDSTLCIGAKIDNVSDYGNEEEIGGLVEEYVNEARTKVLLLSSSASKSSKDRLLQKIRKIVYELFGNSAEHGYLDKKTGYCAIYARIRKARPKLAKDKKKWDSLREKEKTASPTLDKFTFAPSLEWLELFVCDVGHGLLYHCNNWKTLSKTKRDKLEQSKDPLRIISELIFRENISRHSYKDRLKKSKSIITGLQHIGMMLSIDGDYSRMYTSGAWIGEMHPWDVGKISDNVTTGKTSPGYESTRHDPSANYIPGTGYSFCVQVKPDHIKLSPESWVFPTKEQRKTILDYLVQQQQEIQHSDWSVWDLLFKPHCMPPSDADLTKGGAEQRHNGIVVLRPPRTVSKKHLTKWLHKFCGYRSKRAEWECDNFIITDISPFQAVLFEETIKKLQGHKSKSVRFFLVTKTWVISCYRLDTERGLFKFDSESVSNFLNFTTVYKTSAAAILAMLLRQCDSKIFWEDLVYPVFHNGLVEWEKDKDNNQIELDGYLSLQNAISSPSKRYVFLTAIQRCLELLHNYKTRPTDSLIKSVTEELREKSFNDHTSNNSAETILLASVIVTAKTLLGFWKQKAKLSKTAVCGFIHKSATIGEMTFGDNYRVIPALNWTPPELTKIETNYKRIKGTPFIDVHGDKSVSIALYGRDDKQEVDFSKSYYGRNKKQTYRDFEILNCVKLNHLRNGRRHDLLSLNTILAYETSSLEFGALMEWFHQEIQQLCSTENCNSILVHPSHYAADRIIQSLSVHKEFKDLFAKISVVPITFFDGSSTVPLRVSPTSEKELELEINRLKNDSKSVQVIIFDDGVISGKHIREVEDFFLSKEIHYISTIALLDRTGLPLYEDSLKKFSERNKRYWRHDIPHIGSDSSCILCEAITHAINFAKGLLSETIRNRVNEWEEAWKVTDMYSSWGEGGSLPIPLPDGDKYRKVTLGVYVDEKEPEPKRNKFYVHNSTSLSTFISELTRLTTRSDKAIDRAKKFLTKSPLISIEILATQYFLFFGKLTYWEKYSRIKIMLECLAQTVENHNLSAFPGLCLAILDIEICVHLWEQYIHPELISKRDITTLDLIIAIGLVANKIEKSTKHKKVIEEPQTPQQRRNYISCGISQKHLQYYNSFFECIGIRDVERHTVRLHQTLTGKPGIQLYTSNIKYILRSLSVIVSAINKFKITMYHQEFFDVSFDSDIKKLKSYKAELEKSIKKSKNSNNDEAILHCLSSITNFIYKDGKDSLANRYRELFVKAIEPEMSIRSFLKDEVAAATAGVKELMSKNISTGQQVNTAFRTSTGDIKVKILCKSVHEWGRSLLVYLDPLILEFVKEVLLNVRHADGWLSLDKTSGRAAHLWWNPTVENKKLLLTFENKSKTDLGPIKISPNMRALERIGGTYTYSYDTEKNIFKCVVSIPLAESLLKGVTNGF